jgi:hypothetical protein
MPLYTVEIACSVYNTTLDSSYNTSPYIFNKPLNATFDIVSPTLNKLDRRICDKLSGHTMLPTIEDRSPLEIKELD